MTNHNHPLDNAKIGDGATYTAYTDSRAGTIIQKTAKSITIQLDHATLLNGPNSDADDKLVTIPGGFAGHTTGRQRYEYARNPDGQTLKFTRRTMRSGKVIWKLVGSRTQSLGCVLNEGRAEYYDYNF